MRFRRGAELDPSQVSDRRGMRPGPMAVGGGGILGLVILVISLLSGGDGSGRDPFSIGQGGEELAAECQTGEDANQREDCRIVGVINSVQEFWGKNLDNYQPAQTVFFTEGVNTACGAASSQVGPFYCPLDQKVYIDLGFYEDLRQRFGAQGGPFAEAYVIAHEYGHHVGNLQGILERERSNETGPQSGAVRTELMADCLAGMWAGGAAETGFIEELTEADIADGLNAAAAIGDDRIQEKVQGRVEPESWTHGSADARQKWFKNGYGAEGLKDCDTFAVARV